jgi:hypothetical protein
VFTIWNDQYYLASSDQKIALLLLAHEVIIRTYNYTLDYVKGFGDLLTNAFDTLIEATSDIQILDKMFKIVDQWSTFGIFSNSFLSKLKEKLKPKLEMVKEEIQKQNLLMQEGKQAEMRNLKIVKEYEETLALLELDIMDFELKEKKKIVEKAKADYDAIFKDKTPENVSEEDKKRLEHYEGILKNFLMATAALNKKRTEVIYLLSQRANTIYSQFVSENSNETTLKHIDEEYNKIKSS